MNSFMNAQGSPREQSGVRIYNHFSSILSPDENDLLFFNLQENQRKPRDKERKSIILALTLV